MEVEEAVTLEDVVECIDLDGEYHLVYVHQSDELSDEQIDEVLQDGWSESVDEWASGEAWVNACDIADDEFGIALRRFDLEDHDFDCLEREWQPSDDRLSIIDTIMERDRSNPTYDLARRTTCMFRGRWYEPDSDRAWVDAETLDADDAAERLLMQSDLPLEFLPYIREIVPEISGYACEGGGYFDVQFVWRCSVADMLGDGKTIKVSDPFIWFTNPYAGNGYGVVAEGCWIHLKADRVATDRGQHGYSADQVFGGLLLSHSDVERY